MLASNECITATVKTKRIKKCTARQEGMELVLVDGKEAGLITKYRNTRTEQHPWKAWLGVGESCRHHAAYYPAGGGREAALNAVVRNFLRG